MMWNGYGNGWGMAMMLFSNLLFLALLIGGGYLVYRAVRGGDSGAARGDRAEQLLAERYARGEIDAEEYQRRLGVLQHR
jgi:putative membrane protein